MNGLEAKRARLRFQFLIIFGSKQSERSSRLKMLTTNGVPSLVVLVPRERPMLEVHKVD